jgi:hypothetical protein
MKNNKQNTGTGNFILPSLKSVMEKGLAFPITVGDPLNRVLNQQNEHKIGWTFFYNGKLE